MSKRCLADPNPKRRYTLEELLTESLNQISEEETVEDRAWLDLAPAGNEL